ncbi:MAG: type II toxin-antitoxin system RelE/ParE family toxin [Gemmataceae bacterium]
MVLHLCQPSNAARFADAIRNAVVAIGASAESYLVERLDVGWLKLRRYPYLLYFVILDDDRCRVLAVAHERRRP